jgi:hypothetical protein
MFLIWIMQKYVSKGIIWRQYLKSNQAEICK